MAWWVLALAAAQAQGNREAILQSVARHREAVERQLHAVAEQRASVLRQAPQPAPCRPAPAAHIEPLIDAAAERQGLDRELLRAVIARESGFDSCAVSAKGAMGLMQLMPATAADYGVRDPFDPRQNLDSGAAFLKALMLRYDGDLLLALGAYNAGPARVDALGALPGIPETVEYVNAILDRLGRGGR